MALGPFILGTEICKNYKGSKIFKSKFWRTPHDFKDFVCRENSGPIKALAIEGQNAP